MARTVKMSDQMVGIAESEIATSNRSLSGQIEHWANIGRAIESAPDFNYDRVKAALSSRLSPDDLSIEEHEVFLSEFADSMLEDNPAVDAHFSQLNGPGDEE